MLLRNTMNAIEADLRALEFLIDNRVSKIILGLK